MTEATLILGFVGTFVGLVAVIGTLFTFQTRWIRAELGRVVDRLDKLDTDVHAVIVRMMGGGS